MQTGNNPTIVNPHGPVGLPEPIRSHTPPPSSPRFTFERVVRFMLIVGVLLVALWLLWYFFALFVYLAVGVLLAYLLQPFVDKIQGIGLGRIPAIFGTFVLVGGVISVLLIDLVPFVAGQLTDISRQLSFERAVQITAVQPGSTADSAGVQAGQFIVAIDGQPWQGFSQFQSVILSKKPGETLVLVIEDEEGNTRTAFVNPVQVESVQRDALSDNADERNVRSIGLTMREVALSDVVTFIEKQLSRVLPVERGDLIGSITRAVEELFQGEQITDTVSSVVDLFTNLFYAVIVIPLVTFFFLKDGDKIRRSVLRLVPNRYFEVTLAIIEKIETNIGRYFRALLMQCVAVGTVASILLTIAGLNYALAVGIFTGLANMIPYFGPLIGFLAGTVVGITQTGNFSLVPGILIAMSLTQLADNLFFQPFIFSRAARAHPLVILFVVLIGAQLGGIIGMLIAIPITATIKVMIEQIVWSVRNYRILRT